MKSNLKKILIHAGIEKHNNGSFTMFGSICGDTFKMTYFDYSLSEARKLFKKAIHLESDRYFVNQN